MPSLLNNLFYNTKDNLLYNVYDSINGIAFAGNTVSKTIKQPLVNGFTKTTVSVQKIADLPVPARNNNVGIIIIDSLQKNGKERLQTALSDKPGLSNASQLNSIRANATGAKWFNVNKIIVSKKPIIVNCKSSKELIQMLSKNNSVGMVIRLTGNAYHFNTPININNDVTITSNKQTISFSSESNTAYTIKINAGSSLSIVNVQLDIAAILSNNFITTDTSGSANHSNFYMSNCNIINGSKPFFSAAKSSLCDSIIISNCTFSFNKEAIFKLAAETDKKGYYNVEKLKITNSRFNNNTGQVLSMVRSGADESTMGPLFAFSNNTIKDCGTETNDPIINLYGVQQSFIENNNIYNCKAGKVLIRYEDAVSAKHVFRKNIVENSGVVVRDKWVEE